MVGNFSINLSLRQTDILSFSHRVHGLWFSNILKERQGGRGVEGGEYSHSMAIYYMYLLYKAHIKIYSEHEE